MTPVENNESDPLAQKKPRFLIRSRYKIHDETPMGHAEKLREQKNVKSFGMICVFDGHGGDGCSRYLKTYLPRETAALGDPFDIEQMAKCVMKVDRMYRKTEPEQSLYQGSTVIFALFRPLRVTDAYPRSAIKPSQCDMSLISKLPEACKRSVMEKQQDQQSSTATVAEEGEDDSKETPEEATPRQSDRRSRRRKYLLSVGNVGDSRGILVRPNGTFLTLSADHKTDLPAEFDRVVNAGGYVNLGRVNGELAMTRALGDWHMKSTVGLPQESQSVIALPEFVCGQASEGDVLALFCDGLTERITTAQLAGLIHFLVHCSVQDTPDLALAASYICDLSATLGSSDNMSMILSQFQGEHPIHHPSFGPLPTPHQNDALYPVLYSEAIPDGSPQQRLLGVFAEKKKKDSSLPLNSFDSSPWFLSGEEYIGVRSGSSSRGAHAKAYRERQEKWTSRASRYRHAVKRERLRMQNQPKL